MAGIPASGTGSRPETREWYYPLVGLYGIALILSNPFVSVGLFFVVWAVWLVLAFVAFRSTASGGRAMAWALLAAILAWIAVVVPALLFLVVLTVLMWWIAELVCITVATLVLAGAAARMSEAAPRSRMLRRAGLAAGLATGLLMLLPIATLLVEDLEVYAIFHPIVFLLPYVLMLATAGIAAACFALVPARPQEA